MPLIKEVSQTPTWDVYAAAGVGAFFLSISDLLKNGEGSTVSKMSEIVRVLLSPSLGEVALFSILLLVLLGVALCWVYAPDSRAEGFARGFSIFAILAVVSPSSNGGPLSTPNQQVEQSSSPPASYLSFFIPFAYAESHEEAVNTGKVVILLPPGQSGSDASDEVTDTLRDAETEEIVARESIAGEEFQIEKPYGEYILEVEKPGFERTKAALSIDNSSAAYEFPMEESVVPVGLQRLLGFSSGSLEPSEDELSDQDKEE